MFTFELGWGPGVQEEEGLSPLARSQPVGDLGQVLLCQQPRRADMSAGVTFCGSGEGRDRLYSFVGARAGASCREEKPLSHSPDRSRQRASVRADLGLWKASKRRDPAERQPPPGGTRQSLCLLGPGRGPPYAETVISGPWGSPAQRARLRPCRLSPAQDPEPGGAGRGGLPPSWTLSSVVEEGCVLSLSL